MATSRLDILINAKNNTSGALQQTQSMLGGIEKAAGLVAGGFAAAFGAEKIAQVVQMGAELARTGAELDQLRTAFDDLAAGAGSVGSDMLSAMREASRGSIADSELMLSANRAMLLGVADSAEEMGKLLAVAEARGKAMGLSARDAFSDLVTGIGRMSPMILDNLGITVNAAAANEAYAASIRKSVSELTDAEKKQALLNAVLAESADIVRANNEAGTNMVDQFERMDAAIQNAKTALGALFAPATAIVAQAIADAAQAAADGMMTMAGPAAQARQEMAVLDQSAIALQNDLGQLEAGMRRLSAAGQENSDAYREAKAEYDAVRTKLLEVAVAQRANITETDGAAMAMDTFTLAATQAAVAAAQVGNEADNAAPKIANMGIEARLAAQEFDYLMSRTQSNMKSLQGVASQMVDNLGMSGAQDWLNEQNALLRIQQDYWENTLGYSKDYIDNVLTPSYLSGLRDQASELDKSEKSARKLASTVPKISEEYRNLQQAVQSALSGALDPGVGVDPDKILEELFGFREDAVNENARRLADIAANGLKDQDWLGKFAAEAPDIWQAIRMASNPQEEAAFLLRDFQDGLRPDLIDKDRAKELVRRMIRGEANMAELAREISEELAAEMGIPLQEALSKSQAALGIGGSGAGAEIGEALGQGAVDAMTTGGKGAEAVDAFISNMRGVYNRLNSAGLDGGKQWASGFMQAVGENIPGPLINVLVNLVTPGVMAEIYQRGTLTGAES